MTSEHIGRRVRVQSTMRGGVAVEGELTAVSHEPSWARVTVGDGVTVKCMFADPVRFVPRDLDDEEDQ